MLEVDGKEAQRLTRHDDWPPRIIGVSPHGEHLFVLDLVALGRRGPSYALVDGMSGAIEPVETLRPEAHQSTPITGAMLSRSGSAKV